MKRKEIITDVYEIIEIFVEENKESRRLKLILCASDKLIDGYIKDNIDIFLNVYKKGSVIRCRSKVIKDKNNEFLDIIYVEPYNEDNFVDFEHYKTKFEKLCKSVKDKDYKKILQSTFADDMRDLFFEYPAAENNHHNYRHGLLQHSVEVAEISLMFSQYYGNLNSDLLCTAALLHDIGKLRAYDFDEQLGKIRKNDWYKLLGHLSISALFVSKIMSPKIDPEKAKYLYHLILSHHGGKENRSPVRYKMKESFILSYADYMSFKMNFLNMLKYDSEGWSDKNNCFGKDFFKLSIGEINE